MTCVWDSIISGLSDLFRKSDNGRGLFDIISPILNRSDFIQFCEKNCDYMLSSTIYQHNTAARGPIVLNTAARGPIVLNTAARGPIVLNTYNYESIRLNDEPISQKEIEVCVKRIKELDQIEKQDGYNVGAADSFLLFICIFFRINIIHTGQAHYITVDDKPYSPSMIKYKNRVKCDYRPFTCHYINLNGSGECIKLNSSTTHMSYVDCIYF